MRIVDLRSDTLTQPTQEMRLAMSEAVVGDDVFGEDPTVNRLEKIAAERFGKEAALLVLSGTMGNLTAMLSHCERGDEVIVGNMSHIYLAEGGGVSVLGGVALRSVVNDTKGMVDPQDVVYSIRPNDFHYPRTGLIAIENTHNSCGGSVLTPEYIKDIALVAMEHTIPLHIDGARIFNASVRLDLPVSELVKHADSVTFCLSKGLGAPVGSILCGSIEFIGKARRWRKVLGGGMRQAGVIAAAGLVALETMVQRLADDHENAQALALGLSELPHIELLYGSPTTNIVFVKVNRNWSSELVRRLAETGVKIGDRGDGIWRFVTHNGISASDIDYAISSIDSIIRG